MAIEINVTYPSRLREVFNTEYDWKILYGGRSSGKTGTIIRYLIMRAIQKKTLIVCTREYQASIATSTYKELKNYIYQNNLNYDKKNNPRGLFIVNAENIVGVNGSEFIFKGLRRDIMSIKGIPDIGICYVEEAETISQEQWEILIPTVEKSDNSELILAFNPRESTSPTYQMFVENVDQLSGKVLAIEINYPDNPFISKKQLATIEKLKETDYARYEHIYLGKVIDISEDVVFKGYFTVDKLDIYNTNNTWINRENNQRIIMLYGMDFGFNPDPCAMVELCFPDENTIYIHREVYQTKLIPSKYIEAIKEHMPEAVNCKWWGDSARPDTIAELKHMGLNIDGAPKGKGSVEAGIEWLKGKRIIINPECRNTIYEFYNYRHKTDKLTGKILPELVDANNHCLAGHTLVDTELGQQKIIDLVNTEGYVWSFNEDTQQKELNRYYDVRMTHANIEVYEIELADGRIITATEYHPVLTQRGWVEIKDLELTDSILHIDTNINYVGIKRITKTKQQMPVYNMEVENVHNFAIEGGLIVHNCIDSIRYACSQYIMASSRRAINPEVVKQIAAWR